MPEEASPRKAVVAGGSEESWREAWARWTMRKHPSDYEKDAKLSGLNKTLSARDLTVLGVAAIIGAGIFVLPGVGVARGGPGGLVLGFAIAGIVSAFAALNYAELAAMMPISGSAYAYSYVSVGEMLAWLVGWNLILEYALGNVAVAVGWSGALAALAGSFGVNIPAQLLNPPGVADATTGVVGVFNLPAFLIVLLITFILIRGVRESARTATVLVAVKLFVVLFVIFFGAFLINPVNWDPWFPFGVFASFGAGALVFFAYIGFDAVSTAAEETRNPGRDLPIGIIASLVVCTALYILVALIITGVGPWQSIANDPSPIANAFRGVNQFFLVVIAVGGVVGITGVLLVFALGMPRIFLTMARDGLLPKAFETVHPKYRTPYWTTIFGSITVAVFAAFTPIAAAAELVNIGTLFAFLVVGIAVITLRKTMPDAKRPFRVPFAPWVPLAGIVAILGLMAALPVVTIVRFFAWTGIGLIIYGFYGARRSRLGGATSAGRQVVLEPRPGGVLTGGAAPARRR